jgi:predicted RNA-binding protein YlqC (UPF0109 family)
MSDQKFVKEGEELLLSMAKALVDNDEVVSITVAAGSERIMTTVFSVKCAKEDLGKLIGKQGRTAGAMRIILNAIAAKYGRRAVLDIEE